MIVSMVNDIPGLSGLVKLTCSRIIYDPHEIHLSFEGRYWITVACPMVFKDGETNYNLNPDKGNYLQSDFPLYKCVDMIIKNVEANQDMLKLDFGKLVVEISPNEPGVESFSFNSVDFGNAIVILD